jgi:hypothetical protein
LAQALLRFYASDNRQELQENQSTELVMTKAMDDRNNKMPINIMDALLCVLAVSAMIIISVSFLLWLRF